MLYMLDTDICSYILKNSPAAVSESARKVPASDLCISIVTLAELLYGVEKTVSKRINRPIILSFAAKIQIHSWDVNAAESYAQVRNLVERGHRTVASMDLMIASHAISKGATLVTNNTRHFENIPGLTIENWANTNIK